MEISIIVAVSENNVIGKDNDLVWKLSADLKYFKAKTSGHNLIMGRNTFESIGGGRPLPNRITTIVTRNNNYIAPEGCLVANSFEQALQNIKNETEVFICGGAQIYEIGLSIASKLYLTRVHQSFEGDTFFPEIDFSKWNLISEEHFLKDEKNEYDYSFFTYVKK
jgi:dihydrofolate reductase